MDDTLKQWFKATPNLGQTESVEYLTKALHYVATLRTIINATLNAKLKRRNGDILTAQVQEGIADIAYRQLPTEAKR